MKAAESSGFPAVPGHYESLDGCMYDCERSSHIVIKGGDDTERSHSRDSENEEEGRLCLESAIRDVRINFDDPALKSFLTEVTWCFLEVMVSSTENNLNADNPNDPQPAWELPLLVTILGYAGKLDAEAPCSAPGSDQHSFRIEDAVYTYLCQMSEEVMLRAVKDLGLGAPSHSAGAWASLRAVTKDTNGPSLADRLRTLRAGGLVSDEKLCVEGMAERLGEIGMRRALEEYISWQEARQSRTR